MKSTLISVVGIAGAMAAAVAPLEKRACPNVYVFGARETTAPPGYGTAGGLVNQVLAAYPGSASAAIVYPACGGQASCGGASYDSSASQGTAAVVSAVTSYNKQCPNTQIVLIGYSQGGQIIDNALCGGSGSTLSGTALAAVKVAIFMGDPHNVAGLPYNVGTCKAGGFAARPSGFKCAPFNAGLIKSYCDAADPYCCNGTDANVHQGYVTEYGSQALAFIKSKLSSGGTGGGGSGGGDGGTGTGPSGGLPQYSQCGGQGWGGATVCASPYTCKAANAYYSQCL